jgi:hypothetical protein
MIIKTTLIKKPFQAISIWPVILVLPDQANNVGLIEHEMVHYREQAWIAPLWWLRYALSKSFRLEAEVRAYKRQIEVGGISRLTAAAMLLNYGLDITLEQALQLLEDPAQ